MRLINPTVQLLKQDKGLEGIFKQIELVSRTCYKSEDKIDEGSARPFVNKMIASKHTAMLEHGTVYLYYLADSYSKEGEKSMIKKYADNPYTQMFWKAEDDYWDEESVEPKGRVEFFITTNYRVIVENNWKDDLQYLCEPTPFHPKRYTLRFITDRGVSHELVRHRAMSFAQESTRYCNYIKDKFGNELTFIIPSWSKLTEGNYTFSTKETFQLNEADFMLMSSLCLDEYRYIHSINQLGLSPQQARQLLPNALKTEICVTGFESNWKHFFNLRLFGITGKPHPDMEKVASMAFSVFEEAGIIKSITEQLGEI